MVHHVNLGNPVILSNTHLRIAFATPEFVTEDHFDGGLSNYINRVSKALAQLGHEVHVITLSTKNEDAFDHEGVMVHRVMPKLGWYRFNRLTGSSLTTTLHWLNFSTQTYRKLKQLHRRQPFHLIQYPNYSSCGLFSIPLLRATHVVRASSHQPALNDAAGMKRDVDSTVTGLLESLQYKLTRNIHAPSRAIQQTLRDARLLRTPFYLETGMLDSAVYDRFLRDKRYVLFFGRFQLHKGFHVLARALPRFLSECRDACVALVGRDMETPLASSMAAFARAQCNGFGERLIIVEKLPHSQLYPVIAGAQLVVLPSLIDNLPNACLEAMGLGRVVIGTEGTSFEELITDGVNGFLVPPDNPEALADKMIAAWTDQRLAEMSAAAKEKALEFAPEKTIPSLLSYYSEVLSNR
ncbi:MAG TPA: glycosyltransferase family 4 protein [Pyrinomonadaceae bacterium]|nr:glycosyltransferase family 4 protein [Pyrinomonadaceae bacterium]